MQKTVRKSYYTLWAMYFILLVYLFAVFRLDIKEQQVREGYEMLNEYEVVTIEDSGAPIGVRQIYTIRLEDVEDAYCHMMIYSRHQDVRVFLDDECIYRMFVDEFQGTGKSPGCVWNQLSFAQEDNGKELQIEITPVYKAFVDSVPTFYFGNKSDIMQDVVLLGIPAIVLSLLVILIGVIYIAIILLNYQKADVERKLLMLGLAAIQVGLWRLSDADAVKMLFPNYPAISQMPFMALMLVSIPFALYTKAFYSTKDHFVWQIPCIVSLINMGLTFFAHYFGFADMRQMLPFTHVVIAIVFLVILIMTIYEVKTVGLNKKLKRNIMCTGICFLGVGYDILLFYVANGSSAKMWGIAGFAVYIFVMGIDTIQEVKKLMDVGIKALQYEKMAFHDQLTGLYNRTAFAEYTGSAEFTEEKCIIIVMDLNNLKTCNDRLGHDKGDIYIREAARMIHECFEDVGRCYRMGGDEFYVLLENGSPHLCRQKLQALKERVAKCDKVGNGFRMGIACGYKMYDRLLDYDINETARRADKMMYQEKFAMKEL